MSTVKISSAPPDQVTLAAEIEQLRELDVSTLRARWRVVFRKDATFHLPRHLLMRVLAYRLQADRLGELDALVQLTPLVGSYGMSAANYSGLIFATRITLP